MLLSQRLDGGHHPARAGRINAQVNFTSERIVPIIPSSTGMQGGRAVASGCDIDGMFESFLRSCHGAIRRIAAHTRGEHSVSDVEGEAWFLVEELRLEKGLEPAFECPQYQEKIVSYLYQKLVRYTDLNVRRAIRLDHAPDGVEEGGQHPLLAKLAADAGLEPLAILMARENSVSTGSTEPCPHESPAAAYLRLLQRFDNKMLEVAAYLLISRSWCYHRVNEALTLAKRQWPLPKEALAVAEGFEPRSWRKFRSVKSWRQLELDLWVDGLF
ncbi:MAG: hypothetical protein ACWGIK_25045 [Achromobacter pulmonis]